MPLYDVKCKRCGKVEERIAKVDEAVLCRECGGITHRLMPSSHVINMGVGPYGYYDDNLGKYIHTNRQRREEMARQGVSEAYGKGWR